jgi:putative transposase
MIAALNACRFVYNWAIEDRMVLWQYCGVSTSFFDQSAYLKHLKSANPFLGDVHAHLLQDAIKRADRAFAAFFARHKEGHGHPRFKGRDWYDSFTFKEFGNGAAFDGKRLYLSKIGRVRFVLHRPIVGEVKTCTIKRRADGWYILFSVEQAAPSLSPVNEPVGIDVGLTAFATLSNGEVIENPRHLRVAEKNLKRCQRIVSRRKKGGYRRQQAVRVLRTAHLRVRRSRRSFHFTVASRLVKRFNPIFVENLNIAGMVKNHSLAKSISDAGWGQFLGILSHSAESAGGSSDEVRAAGTSQDCSTCGETVPKDLSERWHRCRCGCVLPRDENAARNILQRGWACRSGRAL